MRSEFEHDEEEKLQTRTTHKEVSTLEETELEVKFPSMWNATFPGVVIHELTHYVCILVTRAEVIASSLFGQGKAFVRFKPNSLFALVFISIAPMILGTIIAVLFYELFFQTIATGNTLWAIFWLWLGFSTAMHAHPSKPDMAIASKALDLMWKGKTAIDVLIMLLIYVPIAYPLIWLSKIKAAIFDGAQGSYAWAIILLIFTVGIHQLFQ